MRLKQIRTLLAIIAFSLLTFFFLDFAGIFPKQYFVLSKIQLVPALLAGSFATVAVILLLTLILGRIYCSVLCPLGIYQDIVTWIRKRFRPRMKQKYSKEKKIWRFGVLILVVASYFAGLAVVLEIFEPYSAWGRISTHLLRPAYMAGNNLLAVIFNHLGNYTFYNVHIFTLSLFSLCIAILTFGVVTFLSARHGRTWCNTICPVGTVLGYLSKLSLMKVRFNKENCNSCGLCEMKCKSSCIDTKNGKIDYSRCVSCFDCVSVCKRKGISYTFCKTEKKVEHETTEEAPDNSRRLFLETLAVSALAIPANSAAGNAIAKKTGTGVNRQVPLSPPGSISNKHLLDHCTACHLCVSKCPSNVLKPALLEYGAEGIMQPIMDFTKGYCNYDCTVCSEVCPNGAIKELTKEEKHKVQVGRVHFIMTNCIVYKNEKDCGACSEHCPTQAVSMVPYKDDLTIPSVNPEICVGCGGCEHICPARPKAIYVEGNPIHLKAKAFEVKKQEDVEVDNFGF